MKLEDLADDTCQHCGAPLADDRHPHRVFCSDECRSADYHALERAAGKEARTGMICQQCGSTFDGARTDQLFCSPACARLSMRRNTYGERRCIICDEPFLPAYRGQKTCPVGKRGGWPWACIERLKAKVSPAANPSDRRRYPRPSRRSALP